MHCVGKIQCFLLLSVVVCTVATPSHRDEMIIFRCYSQMLVMP